MWFVLLLAAIIVIIVAVAVKRHHDKVAMMQHVYTIHGRLRPYTNIKDYESYVRSAGFGVSSSGDLTNYYSYASCPVSVGFIVNLFVDTDHKIHQFRSLPHASRDDIPGVGIHDPRQLIGTVYYVTDKKGVNYFHHFVCDPYDESVNGWAFWQI